FTLPDLARIDLAPVMSLVLAGLSSPLAAQSATAHADHGTSRGLSVSAPARVLLSDWSTEWIEGRVGGTTDGCYLILFFPTEPGALPWATTIPRLTALEVAVDSTATGYTWKRMSIETITASEYEHCRAQPDLISHRAAVG